MKKLENIALGTLAMALHHQFTHTTRPASWQAVRLSDIAFAADDVAALITSLNLQDNEPSFTVDAAEIWAHGAIVYRRAHSKIKTERIVPLSAAFATELKRYLELRNQYLAELGAESPWLYPCPRNPANHISDTDMRLLFQKGEEVARQRVAEVGKNPDTVLPPALGTKWYGFRRLWKTEINKLGWERTSASMYAGDWKPMVRTIADDVYARITPGMLLAVIERIPFLEAIVREKNRPGHGDVRDLVYCS